MLIERMFDVKVGNYTRTAGTLPNHC